MYAHAMLKKYYSKHKQPRNAGSAQGFVINTQFKSCSCVLDMRPAGTIKAGTRHVYE
jgi:hypothetical protein